MKRSPFNNYFYFFSFTFSFTDESSKAGLLC